MLGGEPSTVERAAANIQKHYPLLPKVHFYSPPFAPLYEFDNADILRRIEAAKPDIVLMAFGCQKQEKWISMNYKQADVPLMIGVGATIDFLAGKLAGTPRWIARLGLEWVYRLLQEPRRLAGKYWKDIVFLIRQSLRELSAINAPTAPHKLVEPAIEKTDEIAFLNWCGALTAALVHTFPLPSFKKALCIKTSEITMVDSTGLSVILILMRRAWNEGVNEAICDFSGTIFLDSSGLGSLIRSHGMKQRPRQNSPPQSFRKCIRIRMCCTFRNSIACFSAGKWQA